MSCLDRQNGNPLASGAAEAMLSIKGRPVMSEKPAHEAPDHIANRAPSAMEHRFTSTGIKFWKHRDSLESYKAATGRTVISTHVAPEGRCNLKCSYCSVSERTLHNRIELPRIQAILTALKGRGLKAVILTGGGEPTLYPQFNPLAEWILDQGLQLALISNGTLFDRVSDKVLNGLSWLRVSMNLFKDWEQKITIPRSRLGPLTTVGMSLCHSGENKDARFVEAVARFAEANQVSYVRVLPDCMLPQKQLLAEHEQLDRLFARLPGGGRFFHQYKIHGAPKQCTCHQSFFRPYLSEAVNPATGKPGLVFPCDSVVLNDQAMQFKPLFGLCGPEEILDYMDGKIKQPFDATRDCSGCVFTRNVDMLDDYVRRGVDQFAEFEAKELAHENFV